jgi:hypothetical protein
VISEIPVIGWALAIASAFILGLAKGGIKGIGVIIVLLMALAFESKASAGIMMPLLIAGDIFQSFIITHMHNGCYCEGCFRGCLRVSLLVYGLTMNSIDL